MSTELHTNIERTHKKPRIQRCLFGFSGCRLAWAQDEATHRQHHIKDLQDGASSNVLAQINNQAAVYRSQLAAGAFEIFYPEAMPEHSLVHGKLQQWFQPQHGPAATLAADSLLILYASRMGGDPSLRTEGLQRYHSALALLRDVLQKPNAVQDDSLFGAIETLSMIDKQFLVETENLSRESFGAHAKGLYALIVARGPRVLNSPLSRDITLSFLHIPLMHSIMARKTSIFARHGWQARLHKFGQHTGRILEIAAFSCLLPGLLEKTDILLSSNFAPSYLDTSTLLTELTTLETRYTIWLTDRYRSSPSKTQPYTTHPSSLASLFLASTPLSHIPYPFPSTLTFPSILDVLAHAYYWPLLLLLRHAILKIVSIPAREEDSTLAQQKRWFEACAECAENFCMSIPYCFSLEDPQQRGIAVQTCGLFVMPLMLGWYRETGQRGKLAWCEGVIRYAGEREREVGGGQEWSLLERARVGVLTRRYLGWHTMVF